jgi:peroxiredoxin
MAIESKYKKRGSNISLVVMLAVLVALVVAIIMWPFGAEAETETVVDEEVAVETVAEPEAVVEEEVAVETVAEPEAEPKAQSEEDDVEATTLVNVGDVAPDFTVTMLDGRVIKLSELRGNVVMVCFWATWCPPCRQELAHLQEGVIDEFAGEKFVVLPISRGEERKVVEKFITDNGYKFGVGLDSDRAIYDLYASNYIPRTFIVDKQGKVVYRNAGYDEVIAKEVNDAIRQALK